MTDEIEGLAVREFVTQTTFYDPRNPASGNCTEEAVASILGLSLDDVPPFWTSDVPSFWDAFEDFLSQHGFEVLMLPGNWQPDCEYLASGPSVRGCSHMVVMRSGHLLHDPHPSRAGLIEVEQVWLLVHRLPHMIARASRSASSGTGGTDV